MLHRAFDQSGSGGEMFLDDQEVSLPFGCAGGDIAMRGDHDAGLTTQRDLAGDVLERLRVDGHAEAGRQHLAVELGGCRVIDAAR